MMHYEHTGEMIHNGIKFIHEHLKGNEKDKALTWLLGYSAHVITDVTIHPIVELKVGEYAQNKTAHRRCEMNQDAYIFQRLNLGEIGVYEHLDSGIKQCSDGENRKKIDPTVLKVWQYMLKNTYENEFQNNPPNIDKWHEKFCHFVDDFAEEGNHLFPLARHVAINAGLTYPKEDEIDRQYIDNLQTPQGYSSYNDIFNHAIENVLNIWRIIARGVYEEDTTYELAIANWNLDTGKDSNSNYGMWEV
ncbi:zinc dependent phospholipase C family protein [Sulfurimonas sp.]|uniref:zinc dependent phospholipase C family protein n=1 Tax=Sulfurimonas sp. TaxID=2022749 RepID=UPI003D0DFEF6